MKRIVHCLNLDTVGGVESVFADYLRCPQSAQYEQHLMVLNEHCHPFFTGAVKERVRTRHHAKFLGPFKLPRMLRPLLAAAYAKRLRPDLAIVYNTLDNPCAWAAALHAKTRVYYERGAAWWNSAERTVVARHVKLTDRFFCNSQASRRILEILHGVERSRCDVIYNPLRIFPLARPERSGGRFRLGMAGRLIPLKGMVIGLHALADLLKRDAGFELVIAGEGPERAMLEKTAEALGVKAAVTFLGVVEKMPEFYGSLDVFVCPSLREPLGNVAIEANGCGCPVVATQVDGLPEAIVPGKTGLCLVPKLDAGEYLALGVEGKSLPELVYDPARDSLAAPRAISPRELADTIWQLAQGRPALKTMGEQAAKLAHERFRMERYIEEFHRLIERACAS